MSTESEAILEENLIKKLVDGQYQRIKIKDENELNDNFKIQLEKLNKCSLSDDEFNKVLLHLNEGTI